MYRAIDCLGFAGGFTLGTVQAGFQLVGKRELPGGFGAPNCDKNRHLLGSQWTLEIGSAETWTPHHVDFVFGNPPCSGFSVMTDQKFRGVDAQVNECMWSFVTYAAQCRPKIIAFESVRQAFTAGRELMLALRDRLECNTGWRYNLFHVMHDAYELGGAAIRKRYFWVAVRDDHSFGVDFPRVRRPIIRDVWEDLDGLSLTWHSQPYRRSPTWWSETYVRRDNVAVDGHVTKHGMGIQRAYDLIEMAKDYGTWERNMPMSDVARRVYERAGRLPDSWRDKVDKLVAKDFNMGYTQMYRWNEDKPGRVIVGGALNLVIHPWRDRMITHREAARVMGFPDNWLISPMRGYSGLPLTWGKGITVQCGEWIARHVRNALDGHAGSNTGVLIGDREWMIESTPKYGKVHAYDSTSVRR